MRGATGAAMTDYQLTGDQPQPQPNQEPLGRVISVQGSQLAIGLPGPSACAQDSRSGSQSESQCVTVGNFLGVRVKKSLLMGTVTNVSLQNHGATPDQGSMVIAELDMLGEIQDYGAPNAKFHRGVVSYPSIGDGAIPIGAAELRLAFKLAASNTIDIGTLHQHQSIVANVDVDNMLNKHFAILGSTGVGKSSGVALILHEILKARPDLRIFVLDAHNEYGHCFGDKAQVIDRQNLKLPFWLFNFEELVNIFFGMRSGMEEEIEYLAEVIPLAKAAYAENSRASDRTIRRTGSKNAAFTIDTPFPFRISEIMLLLNERMGKLENRSSRLAYYKLMTRIETVCNDPRHSFMFENANVGGDTMAEVLSHLFRVPAKGVPMTVMQFAGFPSDVLDAVVSVLCRMAFELGLWSDGVSPILVVCEEAHRYVSADHSRGFDPTRQSIARIAKEGRKYGVFLSLITQRPSELDPTILSQCSTLFAMRLTNDKDQALVKTTVPDTATNLLSFLPSLGPREVFAFGEGVAMPVRLKFKELSRDMLPRSDTGGVDPTIVNPNLRTDFMASVVDRWRGVRAGTEPADFTHLFASPDVVVAPPAAPTQSPQTEVDRFGHLRRPGNTRREDLLKQPTPDQWRK